MSLALSTNTLLVKEHVGMFKAASNYDVFDAASGTQILSCREPNLGVFTKILRFTDYARMTPFDVELRDMDGTLLLRITRGIALFASKVSVLDSHDRQLGSFKQKLMSLGGKFEVLDASDTPICLVAGKWSGWDFKFTQGERELARVTKKWGGIGKELLTTADNYVVDIDQSVASDSIERKLILAAVLCIDKVLKE